VTLNHRPPEAFQTAGSNVRLIKKSKVQKRRSGSSRRHSSNNCTSSAPVAKIRADPSTIDNTAARKWIPFTFVRRQRRRHREPQSEGQANSVEGQVPGHGDDLEMTLNVDQQRWLDVDLLRNDAASSTTVSR